MLSLLVHQLNETIGVHDSLGGADWAAVRLAVDDLVVQKERALAEITALERYAHGCQNPP